MAFYLPRTPRMLISAPLVLSLAVCVFPLVSVAALGIEAVGEDSQPAAVKQSPLVSSSNENHVIVVGFTGALLSDGDPRSTTDLVLSSGSKSAPWRERSRPYSNESQRGFYGCDSSSDWSESRRGKGYSNCVR
jgi:hypothetical protein